ncbi:MAG: hypothetical protein ACKO23_18220 [Gemmataceae bacterium]
MTSTMMMERTAMGVQGMPGIPTPGVGVPAVSSNWMVVPRCTYRFEKVANGVRITCVCDDPTAKSMMQNLCTALMGGLCSVCCTMNGVTVCTCNLTMGICKVEMTDCGCCITCTSGDKHCCEMIQSCCDCISTMCSAGCTCTVLLNNTPVCCGYSDSHCKPASGKR